MPAIAPDYERAKAAKTAAKEALEKAAQELREARARHAAADSNQNWSPLKMKRKKHCICVSRSWSGVSKGSGYGTRRFYFGTLGTRCTWNLNSANATSHTLSMAV